MNPMVPGLTGQKMSSSEAASKIDLLDPPNVLEKKIKSAFCEPGNLENNGVLSFIKMVLFPLVKSYANTHDGKGEIRAISDTTVTVKMLNDGSIRDYQLSQCQLEGGYEIQLPVKHGGTIFRYYSYKQLEEAYAKEEIHPGDLKASVTKMINGLLQPIRDEFNNSPELQELIKKAYPPESKNDVKQAINDIDIDDEDVANETVPDTVNNIKPQDGTLNQQAPATAQKPTAGSKEKKTTTAATTGTSDVISKLDLRVGKIVKCEPHPNADTLFVNTVDVALESGTIQVVSGLKKYYTAEQLTNKLVTILLNIKPTNMREVRSIAMILAATSDDGNTVELIEPPADAAIGEHITFPSYATHTGNDILARANEKVLKSVFDELSVDSNGNAVYKDTTPFTTTKGKCTVPTLKQGAKIK
jgi:tyrosyl-tRNA synthetase